MLISQLGDSEVNFEFYFENDSCFLESKSSSERLEIPS